MKSPHLLFEWPTRHRIHILLPVMVVLAALAHGAVFFLFAVRQPAPRPGGPNPAQVYFLAPGSAAQMQLAPLLGSMDPALAAPGRGLPMDVPIEASYTPQYLEAAVEFAMPPGVVSEKPETRTFHGPVAIPRTGPAPQTEPVPTPTRLKESDSLAGRLPRDLPAMDFQTRSMEIPPAASFLVAVSPEGTLRHVVTDRSSGEADLDRAAIAYLRGVSFLPDEEGATRWGFVEFQWGPDVKPPPEP